jgi:DMSO/TMAO reductase YedYZ heme-binding membrane subunit
MMPESRTWADELFTTLTRGRPQILVGFKVFYLALVTILFIGGWFIYEGTAQAIFWYRLAPWMGRVGIVAYSLTTIPGIARRLRVQHKLIALLMIYRRDIGVSMYLFVTIHYFFLIGIATWFQKIFVVPTPLFQTMGLTAYVLTFFLFATSNDFSVRRLGSWWHTIHKLTYIIIVFIFLHVALQRVSVWSILIGATLLAQASSHVVAFMRKRRATFPT